MQLAPGIAMKRNGILIYTTFRVYICMYCYCRYCLRFTTELWLYLFHQRIKVTCKKHLMNPANC